MTVRRAASRGRGGIVGCVLIVLSVYAFVAWTNRRSYTDDRIQPHRYYEYLVDGFRAGQLSLSIVPSEKLLSLPDPYDPRQNLPFALHDASLYRGKYYIYFGPTPAVTLMLPWRIAFGAQLPQYFACAIFCAGTYLFTVAILLEARRRHFQKVSDRSLAGIVLVVGFINWCPILLTRAQVWETAIAAALMYSAGAFFCLAKCLWNGGSIRWLVAASLSYGLAIGARPSIAFGAAALLVPVVLSRGNLGRAARLFTAAAVPVATIVVLLLAYNHARFGEYLEFGQRYQLWGEDLRGRSFFSANFLPVNLWLYFLQPAGFLESYPFIEKCALPLWTPANHLGAEEMFGILPHIPAIVACLGIACVWTTQAKGDQANASLRLIVMALLIGALLGGSPLLFFAGVCTRYISELLSGWTALAGLGWLALISGGYVSAQTRRTLCLMLGILGFWSVCFVTIATIGAREGRLRETHPELFKSPF